MRMSAMHRWAMIVIIGMTLITAVWAMILAFNGLTS